MHYNVMLNNIILLDSILYLFCLPTSYDLCNSKFPYTTIEYEELR